MRIAVGGRESPIYERIQREIRSCGRWESCLTAVRPQRQRSSSAVADDGIFQGADVVDGDGDMVAVLEGELGGRDDAGTGHQEDAAREVVVAEEVFDELLK